MRTDMARAAAKVAASTSGSGPFWDELAAGMRPDLKVDGTHAARSVLTEIRRDASHVDPSIRCRRRRRVAAIERWAESRARTKRDEMMDIPVHENGTIRIQRLISCRPDAIRTGLGVFWTSDVYHGGLLDAPWRTGHHPTILITARVDPVHVDWTTSCMARMDLESGEYEKEIRLMPGVPLRDVEAGTWDQTMIPSNSMPIALPDRAWTS